MSSSSDPPIRPAVVNPFTEAPCVEDSDTDGPAAVDLPVPRISRHRDGEGRLTTYRDAFVHDEGTEFDPSNEAARRFRSSARTMW